MREAEAERVGTLRETAFDEGLLRRLGAPAAAALYRAALRGRRSYVLVAEDADGLQGFVLVTEEAAAVQRSALLSSPRVLLGILRWASIDPRRWAAIARRAGRAVLPSSASSGPSEDQPRLRLLDIAVAPVARGRGIGHALIASALDEARRRGHAEIGLSVDASNRAAVELYRSEGFVLSGSGRTRESRDYLLFRRSLDH